LMRYILRVHRNHEKISEPCSAYRRVKGRCNVGKEKEKRGRERRTV
jgi:hypothetical protein